MRILNRRNWTLAFVLLQAGSVAFGQEHWVATWAASPQRVGGPQPAATPAAPEPRAAREEHLQPLDDCPDVTLRSCQLEKGFPSSS
jgi:hypothetical protein